MGGGDERQREDRSGEYAREIEFDSSRSQITSRRSEWRSTEQGKFRIESLRESRLLAPSGRQREFHASSSIRLQSTVQSSNTNTTSH